MKLLFLLDANYAKSFRHTKKRGCIVVEDNQVEDALESTEMPGV